MKNKVREIFQESIEVKKKTLDANVDKIVLASSEIIKALKKKNKIIFFGNGGSAADSQHIAAEFIGRFQKERRALAAIALTTDTSILTALGNDYSFDIVFSRQIEGLGKKGDIAFGISTSGNSKNVIEAIKKAKKLGLKTISLTGCNGGKLAKLTDICIIAASKNTARVQESHSCIIHAICELVENQF
ncbi:MAG: D-sedoheptulose 7-phosphate isomerase [Candidatus Zapsychrus exili]|nr:D-sedoheptulose 7-phosphate isomerase [Candidatus Zapsychrus exili]